MEYWKFPTSEDLFICKACDTDPDRDSFRQLMEQQHSDNDVVVVDVAGSVEDVSLLGKRSLIPVETLDIVVDCATAQQSNGVKQWRRISEVSTIRHVVDLLGHSTAEQHLKKNIVNFLLLERGSSSNTSASDAAPPDPDPKLLMAEEDQEKTGTALTEWLGTKSTATGSIDETATAQLSAAPANHNQPTKKPVVDIVPASLRLQTSKGADISPVYVIQQETVFEDRGDEEEDPEEGLDGESHSNEYFTFGRKYVLYIVIPRLVPSNISRRAATVGS